MFPLNDDFDATSLDSLEPVFNELLSRDVKSVGDLEAFFSDISDMAEHISEAGARLYIGMTCDTVILRVTGHSYVESCTSL